MKSKRNAVIVLVIFFVWTILFPHRVVNAATVPASFMVLPFSRGAIQVQQGWVSHFDTVKPDGKCTTYNPPVNGQCIHGGVDYIYVKSGNWVGFNVNAAATGRLTCYNSKGAFGLYCKIQHTYKGVTYFTIYAHLASTILDPIDSGGNKSKSKVNVGEIIGFAGDTGSADDTGTDPLKRIHLHFELRIGSNTKDARRDPYGLVTTQNQPDHTKYPSATSNKILSPITEYYWFNNPPRIYSQSFIASGQYYEIKSSAGLCLDLTNGSNSNGTKLQLWYDCVKNNNQKWKFSVINASVFVIQSPIVNEYGDNLCVDVTEGNVNLSIQVWGCVSASSNSNQRWRFEINSDGTYLIKNPNYGCLSPISQQNKSEILVKPCNKSDSKQKWKITVSP